MSQDNDRSEAFSLLGEVIRLRADVASIGRKTFRSWLPRTERIEFVASALNLAHYLILRRRDLRPMQRRLMVLGLSSLGRAEGRVLASLDAVMVALASLAATDVPAEVSRPSRRRFFRGEKRLQANTEALLGPARGPRPGRIMVTLGVEAADDPYFITRLVQQVPAISQLRARGAGSQSSFVRRCLPANTRLLAWSLMRSPNIRIMPSIQA